MAQTLDETMSQLSLFIYVGSKLVKSVKGLD